jgi:hypothetical protein
MDSNSRAAAPPWLRWFRLSPPEMEPFFAAPNNQAEKIHADADQFRKLLLRQLAFESYCLEPDSELPPEGLRHLGACNAPKTVVI